MNDQEKLIQEQEQREALEHRDVLMAIGSILKSQAGQQLFTYLFKTFEVAQPIPEGMDETFLREYLGFSRAGNSIYKLVCEADFQQAANILSKIERERYDHIYRSHQDRINT